MTLEPETEEYEAYRTAVAQTEQKTPHSEVESTARTFIGQVFGSTLKELTVIERNSWKESIDILVPDAWYCKWVQDLLFGIVDFVFTIKEAAAYNRGVQIGDQIYDKYFSDLEAKAKEVISKLAAVDKLLDQKIVNLDDRVKALEGKKGWLEPFLSIGK